MNTTYYTLTTWNESAMAAGFDGGEAHQAVLARQQPRAARPVGGDNVIDLAAWRAANRELWDEPAQDEAEPDQPRWEAEALELPVRRVRKSRRAMVAAELASTLSVVAVAVVLILRVLLF